MKHTVIGNLDVVGLEHDGFLVSKKRKIRIWTPTSYDKNAARPYDVIYMFDGQNLFDETTSFAGEWKIDESIEEASDSEGIRPSIVVGLDCSADRLSEYLPSFSKHAISDLGYKGTHTFEFLISSVMPYVESRYNVRTDRRGRAIGGSSMGGLMALAGGIFYPDLFSGIYAFSNAFALFRYGVDEEKPGAGGTNNDEAFDFVTDAYSKARLKNRFRIAITAGGQGMEGLYTRYALMFRKRLLKSGWDGDRLLTLIDRDFSHNEEQWAYFFPQAYRFMKKK